jgi:hypothetical protein
MTMAWTRALARGLLFGSIGLGAQACVVSVDDDPDDNFGGTSGEAGSAGSGSGGRSGSGGSTSAGSGGSAGDATGGTGGSGSFPAPTCDEEAGDDMDECARCLKQNCCDAWLGCDDETCSVELEDVSACVQELDFATTEDLGMCISMSSAADDGFVQENTQTLIDCAIAPGGDAGIETLCSTACFGSEIFPE